jgi:hypothetical protein
MGKKMIRIFIIIVIFTTFIHCTKDVNRPENLLEKPVLLDAPLETAIVEKGIDAVPEQDAIEVQWELNSIFKGYKVYRRTQDEDEFSPIRTLGETDSLFIDSENIVFNKRYYYYLLGRDKNNNWSQPSDTVNYLLINKAFNLEKTVKQNKLTFHWQIHDFSPEKYYLKLYDENQDEIIWLSEIMPSYTTLEEKFDYNWDGKAITPNLTIGIPYRWRVDIKGPSQNSGSESNWQRFTLE